MAKIVFENTSNFRQKKLEHETCSVILEKSITKFYITQIHRYNCTPKMHFKLLGCQWQYSNV